MGIAAAAAIAVLSSTGIAAAAGQNDDGQSGGASIESTAATQTFNFSIPNATTKALFTYNAVNTHLVRFDTRDVGIPGDHWKVAISGGGQRVSGPCGSGSTSAFSGLLSVIVSPGTYRVTVSLCRGVGVFPAAGKLRVRN